MPRLRKGKTCEAPFPTWPVMFRNIPLGFILSWCFITYVSMKTFILFIIKLRKRGIYIYVL
jgi:hypothetical protein